MHIRYLPVSTGAQGAQLAASSASFIGRRAQHAPASCNRHLRAYLGLGMGCCSHPLYSFLLLARILPHSARFLPQK